MHGKGGPILFERSPLLVRTAARAPHATGDVPWLRGARSTCLLRAPPPRRQQAVQNETAAQQRHLRGGV